MYTFKGLGDIMKDHYYIFSGFFVYYFNTRSRTAELTERCHIKEGMRLDQQRLMLAVGKTSHGSPVVE